MWPHVVAASYSAKNEDAIRWNAIRLPFYQLLLLLVYFAGFSAIILRPGLTGGAVDESFMLVVQEHYSSRILGFIAGAGCLAALIPAGTQVRAAASLSSRNIINPLLGTTKDEQQKRITRALIVFIAILAVVLWLFANTTIIGLVLMGYSLITQLFPGVILSFLPRPPRALSVGLGIVVALVVLFGFSMTHKSIWFGLNVGLVALLCNMAVVIVFDSVWMKLIQRSYRAVRFS